MAAGDRIDPPPQGCLDPARGRLLERYLDGELSEAERDRFEEHFFACPACLEELRLRQALPEALQQMPARGRWALPAMAAAVLLLAAIVWSARSFVPERNPPPPLLVELQGQMRGGESAAAPVPAGRPLTLALYVPVPGEPGVTYAARVTGPDGETVFEADGVRPHGRSEVRLSLPDGVPHGGWYRVELTERRTGNGEPARFLFSFEARGNAPRRHP